ncbi:DEAD/DEAH box helicase family protein, partial [Enterococcus faecium]
VQGKFTGVFSALQMFVVSNGSDTRYIAAAQDTRLNEQFLATWVDANNDPVTSYLAFAQHVLSIPQAHKMVTQYTVIDSDKKALLLLRPYQIHAIEAIKQASIRQESGYVWHTTGSGKTLTSYKAARNLLHIPSLDKTIFIVDRVDLDQQTTSSFASYAENDVIQIDETDNVKDLIKKLLSA